MPELPEIASRASEMKTALVGKTISAIQVLQPKCLNVEPDVFVNNLTNAAIKDIAYKGKWLFVETTGGWLLLSLGMGGEILLVDPFSFPEKYRLVFEFTDGTCLVVNFWWFGHAHYVPLDALETHSMTAKLGPNAIDLSAAELKTLMQGQRKRLKDFLLDQSRIAGIGNAYIHDILFLARLHPMRPVNTLTDADFEALYNGIQNGLRPSLEKGGAFYELNLYGQKGGFVMEDILIGYRENQPCPNCGTPVQKLKTGSTTGFICPQCQVLPE